MGVDPERGAGDQGQQVAALLRVQGLLLLGRHHLRLTHLVDQHLSHHLDGEGVAGAHPVQIGEHGGLGEAAMGGDDGVGGLTTHREGRALQVPGAAEQRQVGGAVVDGKIDIDARDPDPGHDLRRALEQFVVFISGGLPGAPGNVGVRGQDRPGPEFFVVGPGIRQGLPGLRPPGFVPGCLSLPAQRIVVGVDQPRLLVLGEPRGGRGVTEKHDPRQRTRRGQPCR